MNQINEVVGLLVALCDTVLEEGCAPAPVLRLMSAFLGELDSVWASQLNRRVLATLLRSDKSADINYIRNELLMCLLEQSYPLRLKTVDLSGNSVSLYHLQSEHELTEDQMERIKQVIYEN